MAIFDFFNKRNKDSKAEMSFIDHLEDLRWHVVRSIIAVAIGAIIVFVYSDFVVNKILFAPTRSDFVSSLWLCRLGHFIGIGDTLCFPDVKAKFLEKVFVSVSKCFPKSLISRGVSSTRKHKVELIRSLPESSKQFTCQRVIDFVLVESVLGIGNVLLQHKICKVRLVSDNCIESDLVFQQ